MLRAHRPGVVAPRRLVAVLRIVVAVLALLAASAPAAAQRFDENRYYQQCLRFEAGGDLETARQSCLNALQVKADFPDAQLALARIEVKLGMLDDAEQRLQRVRGNDDRAEIPALLAEIAVRDDRFAEAEGYLSDAEARLSGQPNRELSGQVAYIRGRLAQHQGRYDDALAAYGKAIDADGLNVDYRLADARLRFDLGDPAGARDRLRSYMDLSGDTHDAEVRSLLGRSLWSMSDLGGAAGELETALALRTSRDTDQQAADLRSLALIYYAQGDTQSGNLALREAASRGNVTSFLFSNALLWLFLLLLLVAVHLVGESRIANATTLEVVEGPQPWTVGQLYGVLFASVLIGLLAALVYGVAVYNNVLAFVTPLQQSDARAVFLLVFTLCSLLLVWRRVGANGFDATERLLGSGDQALAGFGLGVLFLAATLAYLAFVPENRVFGPFYLNLSRLTVPIVVAMVLLPLTELYFRAFMIPALSRRYDGTIAVLSSAGVYALVLVTPVLLLGVFGLVLAAVFRRRANGITVLLAQIVLNVGLVLAVAFVPWARSLFLP